MSYSSEVECRDLMARIKQLEAVAKCDCCGKPFDQNGGICEPCHSSAIAQHIKPLGSRIRELEAAVQSETANKLAANLKVIDLEADLEIMKRGLGQAQVERDKLATQVRLANEAITSLKQESGSRCKEAIAERDAAFAAAWDLAHSTAKCGHARANWKDPKYGTPEYQGEEKCEVCAIEAATIERVAQAVENIAVYNFARKEVVEAIRALRVTKVAEND